MISVKIGVWAKARIYASVRIKRQEIGDVKTGLLLLLVEAPKALASLFSLVKKNLQ